MLIPISEQLMQDYPNENIRAIFASLPQRTVTTGLMAICERVGKDIGYAIPESVLQAIGTLSLHISTHDDVISEISASRTEQATLLYAGDISLIEGSKLLLKDFTPHQAEFIWEQINRNHFLQQKYTEALRSSLPRTFDDYSYGIEHRGAVVALGVCTALAYAHKEKLWPTLEPLCINYGNAIQLLDDICDVSEDMKSGYYSYPLLEGAPYRECFQAAQTFLDKAQQGLPEDWYYFGELIHIIQGFAGALQRLSWESIDIFQDFNDTPTQ